MDNLGLYEKYTVMNNSTGLRVGGSFVLLPEKDIHAAFALQKYAEEVRSENPALAEDLLAWLGRIDAKQSHAGRQSREEIDALKANWSADPSWDIEDTPGFEWHRLELVEFHLRKLRVEHWALQKKYGATMEARIESLSSLVGMLQAELTTLEAGK
jgi:hypothetical protein